MGLFKFLQQAGRKLGIDLHNTSEAPRALKKEVENLGLQAENLQVDIEGSKVRVKGQTASQEDKEKILLALGNIEGVETVEDVLDAKDPAPSSQFHTVRSGDTLSAIAKTYYGSPSKYHVIFEANKPMLSDPDKIYPGQVLRIPQQS